MIDLDSDFIGRTIVGDIVAYDANDQPILIVEVKPSRGAVETGRQQVLASMAATGISLGMFVDLDFILVYQSDSADPRVPISELKTSEVLSIYEPEFGRKRIFHEHLETLTEAWLRDFAFHWKSEHPPAFEQMQRIGLAERLAGGITQNVRMRAISPLRRD